MKYLAAILLAVYVHPVCADAPTSTNAPNKPAVAPAAATPAPQRTPASTATQAEPTQSIPGGYNPAKITDRDVQAAAAFAVSQMQQGSLVQITAAQVQVVAGKNYAIDMILNQNGVNYQYHVVVYVPLPSDNQPMQLTNVEAMGQVDDSSTTTPQS